MITVLVVFGTRPEAIKMAPVINELKRHPDMFRVRVCVTGQHRHMLDQVLALFRIVPDYDLAIMRPAQSLTDVTVAVLRGLDPILETEQPDWVLVQGDTATVLAASLAAFYRRVRVGHVEAGLRTHNKYQPFPEEINRRVAGVIADVHFAPTPWAAANLHREGVPERHVVVTGNTVIDAIQNVATSPFEADGTALAELPFGQKRLVLVTAHRRENFGQGMEDICAALRRIACCFADVHLVYPVHLNPYVQAPVRQHLSDLPNVTLLPPLEYRPLVWLLQHCSFVITDSGGLQEEAPGLGKPVLVLRDTTERPEGVAAGTCQLVGTCQDRIVAAATRLLTDPHAYYTMASVQNPYGDGCAARRIVKVLAAWAEQS